MQTLRAIVFVLAVLTLAKGVWCLLEPASFRRTVDWWLRMPAGLARVWGVALVAAGVLLMFQAVRRMTPVLAVATVAGTALVLAGLLHLRPAAAQAVWRPFASGGNELAVRIAGVLAILLAGMLLLVSCHRA